MSILECIIKPVIVCRQNTTAKTLSLRNSKLLILKRTDAVSWAEICESALSILYDTNITFCSLHDLHYRPPNSSPSFSSPAISSHPFRLFAETTAKMSEKRDRSVRVERQRCQLLASRCRRGRRCLR